MSSRPNWGLQELDFVFSTLVVGSIMNFSLMYLLAPTAARGSAAAGAAAAAGRRAGAAGGSRNPLAALFDERTLTSRGIPGGHIFEPGFTLAQRSANLAFKGVMFGVIGFAAGVVGTAMSNGLLAARRAADPGWEPPNEAPNILLNSLAWTLHMGVSSNVRYQMLNGFDMAVVGALPPAAFKGVVVVVRTLNNVLGGISFVTCARLLGSQKTTEPVAPPPPADCCAGNTKKAARAAKRKVESAVA